MMYLLGFGMLCAIAAVVWRILKPKTRMVCRYEVDYVALALEEARSDVERRGGAER